MRIILLLFAFSINIAAQNFEYNKTAGKFRNANSFYINPAGFIYVSCVNENKIFKLDTLGNVLKEIGGYGWDKAAFDFPADIFATPLNIYVTDKNNNRIQWFDKDLNFISQLQTRDSRDEKIKFAYPLGSAVSSQGDLYVLDSENNRVLKFDMFGNFLTEIGGLDAGKFRINRPLAFVLSGNTVFVLDDKGKRIVLFDQFGNGVNIFPLDKKADNISSSEGKILLNNKSEIFLFDQSSGKISTVNSGCRETIRDVFLFGKKLFILTPTKIIINSGK